MIVSAFTVSRPRCRPSWAVSGMLTPSWNPAGSRYSAHTGRSPSGPGRSYARIGRREWLRPSRSICATVAGLAKKRFSRSSYPELISGWYRPPDWSSVPIQPASNGSTRRRCARIASAR